MPYTTITPLHGRKLVKADPERKVGLIYLGSERRINATRTGVDVQTGSHVEYAQGGYSLDDGLVVLDPTFIVRIDGTLQKPYVRITPEEVGTSGLLTLPSQYFSGWYRVVEAFDGRDVLTGRRCLPFYGTPRLPMSDDSEYCHIDSLAVVEFEDA